MQTSRVFAHRVTYIIIYVIVIPRYEYDIVCVRGKAEYEC